MRLKYLFTTTLILVLICFKSYGQYISNKKYLGKNNAVFVEGFINFNFANYHQSQAYSNKLLPDNISKNNLSGQETSLGNDSQIFLKATHKISSQQRVGSIAKFEFNISSNKPKQNPNLDQIYLFFENNFGNFEVGNNFAVNQKMKYGPAKIARGSGGINGKYLQYVNLPMLSSPSNSTSPACNGFGSTSCSTLKMPRFITLAQLPVGHGGYAKSNYSRSSDNLYDTANQNYLAYNRSNFRAFKDDSYDGYEDALKLSYYTPRIQGIQFGLSYAYDSHNNGFTANTAYDSENIRLKNILSVGVNYLEDFNNLGVAISSTAEKANVQNSRSSLNAKRYDLMAYDIGMVMSYFGFKFALSYGNWNKSLQPQNGIYSCNYNSQINISSQNCTTSNNKFRNPYYYTTGLSYQIGPISTSITSLHSYFQNNKYRAISFGLDYKYSKNILPYFEITHFNFMANQPQANDIINNANLDNQARQIKNNQGKVFLTGILYSF